MNTFKFRPILYFVLLAFGLAWLVALPLWLNGGRESRFFTVIGGVMMGVPALAAVIVSKFTEPKTKLSDSLGLRPWRPIGRTLLFCLFAILASMSIMIISLVVGSAFGVYRFDLHHFSGLNEMLHAKYAGNEAALAKLPPLGVMAAILTLQVIALAPFGAILAIGEEMGWRGWLLPKLMPLGTIRALTISGAIWALWHAPLNLLGYNYGSTPGWLGLLCMTAMCIVVGAVLAWLRLRSGSVWPAALGHAAFNAAGVFVFIFGASNQQLDMTQATPLGWTGWIFPALLAMALFHFFPKSNGPALGNQQLQSTSTH
jgi:membrane protease YdiL (CAAX protease family)